MSIYTNLVRRSVVKRKNMPSSEYDKKLLGGFNALPTSHLPK